MADRQGFGNLLPSSYTITETPVAGWELTGIECSSEFSDTVFDPVGSSVTITLAPGDDTASCTFVNTKDAFIIVDKVTDPEGDPAVFDFTIDLEAGPIDFTPIDFSLSDESTPFNSGDLDPGNYSVSEFEEDDGWDLATAECVSSFDDEEYADEISLDAGEIVTCTFTNTKRGTVIIVKDAVPNSAQDFAFTENITDEGPTAFTLDDDDSETLSNTETFENVVPGTYTVTEALVPGWLLTGLNCDDTDSTGNTGTRTANIVLDPDETVTCTYTNIANQDAPTITSDGGGETAAVSVVEGTTAVDGDFVWAKQLGGTSWEYARDVAVDAAGNVYTVGSFNGTVDFDPGAGVFNLTSLGNDDVFVSKLDSNGDFVWAKQLGSTDSERAEGLAVDAAGNVYTVGSFRATVDFDPGAGVSNLTPAGNDDVFVSKLDSNGDFVWAKQLGSTSWEYARDVAVDAAGNVYTVGSFNGTVDFDPGAGVFNLTSLGNDDVFVSKLDSNGDFVWAKQLGSTDSERAEGLAVDAAGNVYTVGSFRATVDFDPGAGVSNLTPAGSNDVFVSKLDSNGDFVWAKQLGGTDYENAQGVAVDGSGNVYTVGYFNSTADFDPGTGVSNLTPAGSDDVFVSKLDSNGDFVWAKQLGGTDYEYAQGVAVDGSGNVYTVGSFYSTADFDPGTGVSNLTPAGSGDVFVSKLDSNGDFVWAKQLGGTDYEYAQGVAVDGSGNVYTVGSFYSTADFDPGTGVSNLTPAGSDDVFVSKLAGGSGNIVTDVESSDDFYSEGAGLSYSLTDDDDTGPNGSDNNLFTLNATTGQLSFTVAPAFSPVGDADQNNDYEVQVTVTDDAGLADNQNVTITLLDPGD